MLILAGTPPENISVRSLRKIIKHLSERASRGCFEAHAEIPYKGIALASRPVQVRAQVGKTWIHLCPLLLGELLRDSSKYVGVVSSFGTSAFQDLLGHLPNGILVAADPSAKSLTFCGFSGKP